MPGAPGYQRRATSDFKVNFFHFLRHFYLGGSPVNYKKYLIIAGNGQIH